MKVKAPFAGARRRASSDGFTLLELLIAIALLGLIFAALAGGLRFGTAAWQAGSERLGDSDNLQLVHRVVRRQLEAAITPAADGADEDIPVFEGRRDRLQFLAPAPSVGMPPGLYQIGLRLQRNAGSGALVLDWSAVDREGGGTETLIDNVARVRFSYLGTPGGTVGRGWTPDWRDLDRPPQAIRMDIGFKDGSRSEWPVLVFAVPAADGP